MFLPIQLEKTIVENTPQETLAESQLSTETMKTLKLVEAAARYRMTPARFEALLVNVGWMIDGRVSEGAILNNYLTDRNEITPLGQGYLFEASRE